MGLSEDYEDELVTSHSDENPELGSSTKGEGGGGRSGPLAAYSTEGRPADDLYREQQREDGNGKYFHKVKPTEHVTYEETYIPDPYSD